MKMRVFSLALGATLGVCAMQVSADALLAPYFKVDNAKGVDTYYLLKTRGEGVVDAAKYGYPVPDGSAKAALHNLHFTYFYKDLPNGWKDQKIGCDETNLTGTVSSWDLVYGSVYAGNPFPSFDKSAPPALGLDLKEGFMIIEEEYGVAGSGQEGDLSGDAWIVNLIGGHIIAYKMLNNPTSTDGNNWDTVLVAKDTFDMMWWPTGTLTTAWPTLVVGNNMLEPGQPWNGAIKLQAKLDDDVVGVGGPAAVYNNDEKLISGLKTKDIVCAGWVTRPEILGNGALLGTVLGGWGRFEAVVMNDGLCDPAATSCPKDQNGNPVARATGALMMKYQQLITAVPQEAAIGFTIESSGVQGVNNNAPY